MFRAVPTVITSRTKMQSSISNSVNVETTVTIAFATIGAKAHCQDIRMIGASLNYSSQTRWNKNGGSTILTSHLNYSSRNKRSMGCSTKGTDKSFLCHKRSPINDS